MKPAYAECTNKSGGWLTGTILVSFCLLVYVPLKLISHSKTHPRQTNGVDCGVFVCMNSFCLINRLKMNFTQAQMPDFRKEILADIMLHTTRTV